jgi:hypothetical protein
VEAGLKMETKGNLHLQEIKIQELLDRYLKAIRSNSNLTNGDRHLDEDSLNAFVEGNVSRRELPTIVSHLVDCSFCLHITAELARLDMAFAGEDVQTVAVQSEQPSRISEVLSGLLSRIFGTNDGVVFAHEEKEEESEEAKEESK